MKLLLMADQRVGLGITRWLTEHYPEDLALVVATAENDVFGAAQEAGIARTVFSSPEEIKQWFTDREIIPDLGILAWWPKLLKKTLLAFPRRGFINTHPSLLPYNRGKHYNFWSLVEQSPFGVSLHFVDEGVDTGDIVAQQPIPYDWEDTGGSLYNKALEAMVALFKNNYPAIRRFDIDRRPQSSQEGSYHRAEELDPACHIDLNKSYGARELLNLLRARTFPGCPACWFDDEGEQFEVRVEIKRKPG